MLYFIWSTRKNQWYGPDEAGYTDELTTAGKYTAAEAGRIALHGLPGQLVPVDERVAYNQLAELRGADVTKQIDVYRNY